MGVRTVDQMVVAVEKHQATAGKGERLTATQRCVLFALSHHHNDVGRRCDPSVAAINRLTGFSDSTIRAALKAIPSALLEREHRNGQTPKYRLPWYEFEPQTDSGPRRDPARSDADTPPGAGGVGTVRQFNAPPGAGGPPRREPEGTPPGAGDEQKEQKLNRRGARDARRARALRAWDRVEPQLSHSDRASTDDEIAARVISELGGWRRLGHAHRDELRQLKWRFVDRYAERLDQGRAA